MDSDEPHASPPPPLVMPKITAFQSMRPKPKPKGKMVPTPIQTSFNVDELTGELHHTSPPVSQLPETEIATISKGKGKVAQVIPVCDDEEPENRSHISSLSPPPSAMVVAPKARYMSVTTSDDDHGNDDELNGAEAGVSSMCNTI